MTLTDQITSRLTVNFKKRLQRWHMWGGGDQTLFKIMIPRPGETANGSFISYSSWKSRKPLKMICLSLVSFMSPSLWWSLKDSSQTFCPTLSCKTTPPDSTWNATQSVTTSRMNPQTTLLFCPVDLPMPHLDRHQEAIKNTGQRNLHFAEKWPSDDGTIKFTDLLSAPDVITETDPGGRWSVTDDSQAHADLNTETTTFPHDSFLEKPFSI